MKAMSLCISNRSVLNILGEISGKSHGSVISSKGQWGSRQYCENPTHWELDPSHLSVSCML